MHFDLQQFLVILSALSAAVLAFLTRLQGGQLAAKLDAHENASESRALGAFEMSMTDTSAHPPGFGLEPGSAWADTLQIAFAIYSEVSLIKGLAPGGSVYIPQIKTWLGGHYYQIDAVNLTRLQ